MKKVFIIVLIVLVIGLFIFLYLNRDSNKSERVKEKMNDTAIIYFSATGNTEEVANYLGEITGGKVIQIIPKDEYTSSDLNYNNDDCRANREQNDDSARPEIANEIDTNYEIIYLGFPIWWGDVPKIILTFLDTYDLDGKTVIPFCTSGGSSISSSLITLREYKPNINWVDGERISISDKEAIDSWVSNLQVK